MILCIDLGTTTGWAAYHSDGKVESGSVSFKPSKFDGGGMRYMKFVSWLTGTMKRPTEVYFESVRKHNSVDAAHVYGGLMATLTTWCEQNRIPYAGVPVGTIKKHITGKGNAGKDEVIKAVSQRGYNVKDDNEADAIAILSYVVFTKLGEVI